MTAHEHQRERVILLEAHLTEDGRDHRLDGRVLGGDGLLAAAARDVASHFVGEAPNGDLIQPPSWIRWDAFGRPLRRRGDERFLHSVFRRGEVLVPSCDGAEHPRREVAQQVPERGVGGFFRRRPGHMSGGALMT